MCIFGVPTHVLETWVCKEVAILVMQARIILSVPVILCLKEKLTSWLEVNPVTCRE
jgi:hypothetical protein